MPTIIHSSDSGFHLQASVSEWTVRGFGPSRPYAGAAGEIPLDSTRVDMGCQESVGIIFLGEPRNGLKLEAPWKNFRTFRWRLAGRASLQSRIKRRSGARR